MTKWDKYIKSITSAVERTDYLYEKWSKLHDENSYVTKIMYMIYVTGLVRQKDIVENYGMPKQTVNTVITGLLKNGYINLTPDKTDKRSKIIELTDSGLEYANSIIKPLLDCEKKVLAEMGEERVKLMIETMNQYANLFEKYMNKANSKN